MTVAQFPGILRRAQQKYFALDQSQANGVARAFAELSDSDLLAGPMLEGELGSGEPVDDADSFAEMGEGDEASTLFEEAHDLHEQRLDELRESLESAQEDAAEAQGKASEEYRAAIEVYQAALGQVEETNEQRRAAIEQARAAISQAREAMHGQAEAERARARADQSRWNVLMHKAGQSDGALRLFSRSAAAAEPQGDLARRVEALERLARQRGFESGVSASSSALEDRVAELERFMQGGGALPGHSSGPLPLLGAPLPPSAVAPPHALAPRTSGSNTWFRSRSQDSTSTRQPRTGARVVPPSTATSPIAPVAPTSPTGPRAGPWTAPEGPTCAPSSSTATPPRAPVAPLSPTGPGTGPWTAADGPTCAPFSSSEPSRTEIERAMDELRAQAEVLRAEMARVRAKVEALPRNER